MESALHHLVQEEPPKKSPVVRGARACTVCRAAKMKCVDSEDGTKPCQRCKRSNSECVFEKHRRGRKPGSKLSEASKMLRRLEKGLSSAKLKAFNAPINLSYPAPDPHTNSSDSSQYQSEAGSSAHHSGNELPSHIINCREQNYASSTEDDNNNNRETTPDEMYPARLIKKENRNSFFQTILNPQNEAPGSSTLNPHDFARQQPRLKPSAAPSEPPPVLDPISAGIMDEKDSQVLWDLIFLRLNPFINLFDPALHSLHYVRTKCRFLFTVLIMAGTKFFKPEYYRQCQDLANEHAVRAFSAGWKSVEVVQAFACLTYWKEPDDTRTWTYIGYACRMAVELGLNKYLSERPKRENDFQLRERRNRERTYMVLFVHDRSLSMQTGRQWMLPEDELVKRSATWHELVTPIRPEDVILSAQVQLRRIAAETMETSDVFGLHGNIPSSTQTDVNIQLRNCNARLDRWREDWQREILRAKGESFHLFFLDFFQLYVRLFLNSFGLRDMGGKGTVSPSLQAFSVCYRSAMECLQIISKDFRAINMLRYGQESITIMSAYCAIFLLKLLHSSKAELPSGTTDEVYNVILQTADAYQDTSHLCLVSGSASHHARFLGSLVTNDRTKYNQDPRDARRSTISTTPQGVNPERPHPPAVLPEQQQSTMQQYPPPSQSLFFPAPPITSIENYVSAMQGYSEYPSAQLYIKPSSEVSYASYSRNILKDLGYDSSEQQMSGVPATIMDANATRVTYGYSSLTHSGQQYGPVGESSYL